MSNRPPTRLLTGSTPGWLVAAAVVVVTVAGVGAFAVDAGASHEDGDDDTRENATVLQMNRTVEGTIDGPNDTDWYAVEAGDVKRLLAGVSPNDTSGAEEDPPREYKDVSITLYGPDGEQVATARTYLEQPKRTAGVNHAVESGDTYYVEVASEYGDEAEGPYVEANGSQDYELDVESVALDTNEPNDDAANAADLSTGETVSANILRIESDAYAVELEEADSVTVTYEVTARLNHNGAAMPTKTYVENPSGERVAPADYQNAPTGSATYTFTANGSGTYVVTVTANTDLKAVSGVRGNDLTQYDLRVDASRGSRGGGEPTATATPPAEDDSGADTGGSEGADDEAGDQPASGRAPAGGGQATTSVPDTATSTGTPAPTPTGTDVSQQTETPVDPTQSAEATPAATTDQPAVTATEAPGQPGFGFAVAVSGVLVATLAVVRNHRRSGQ